MCRYANYGPYKKHYACFACRKGFKRLHVQDWPEHLRSAEGDGDRAPCPECGRPMADMGLDFKPPRRNDVEHWEVVAFLFRRGFAYHSCGCSGPGYRPSRWRDVPGFLEAHHCQSAGELLAAKFEARKRASHRA
jgi:hypothetical protein